MLSQTIIVPTEVRNNQTYNGFTATQNYTYDSLNRIKQAAETVSGQLGNNWQQTFQYDRFGNRTFDEANTTTLPKNCGTSPNLTVCAADRKIYNPTPNTSDNRLSSSDGYQFDNAGNTTKDAQNRKFTYDAENRQTKVETVDTNGNITGLIGQYWYDGDGKRIRKYAPENNQWTETVFVYDAFGKLVAEYSTQIASPQNATVSYLTTDTLGSPRINTDQNGAVTARHDYQPFGEEIQRTSYGADQVRNRFTSYERDTETDLDFAQARMYANKLGRFTTVDPIALTTGRLRSPQSINLYVYSINRPLSFIDPSGEKVQGTDANSQKKYDDYKNWVEAQYKKDPKKFESLRATIKTLEESGVLYNISVTNSSKLGDNVEGSVGISSDGKSININVVFSGGTSQEFSQNPLFAHELEHARQFNDGEWGFELIPDKNGSVTVDGKKYKANTIGYDIGEETKAWKAMISAANAFDMSVKVPRDSIELPILQRLDGANDKESDKIIARINNDYKQMNTVDKGGFADKSVLPTGTAISPTSGAGSDGRRAFGCVRGGCKW